MGLEMVLNDLSLVPLAANEWAARQRMERLIGTLLTATKLGAEQILQRVFSWHCRVTPEPWRIYFFPLLQGRQVIIGHVGHHLPTVRHH